MKKWFGILLVLVLCFCILVPTVPVSASTQSQTNVNTYYPLYPSSGQQAAGLYVSNFQGTLSSVSFYLTKTGNPTGNIWAMVRRTADDVSLGTFETKSETSITNGWNTFLGNVTISASTAIKIFVEVSAGNPTDCINVGYYTVQTDSWSSWAYFNNGWNYNANANAAYQLTYDTATAGTSNYYTYNGITYAIGTGPLSIAGPLSNTGTDNTAAITQLQSTVTSLNTATGTLSFNVDKVLSTVNAVQAQLNNVTDSTKQIDTLITKVDNLATSVSSLSKSVDTFGSTVSALKTSVDTENALLTAPPVKKSNNSGLVWTAAIVVIVLALLCLWYVRRRQQANIETVK